MWFNLSDPDQESLSNYHIFQIIRHTTPQIWEENGGASYSPNVPYMACLGGLFMLLNILPDFLLQKNFSYLTPLKHRCVLRSEKYSKYLKEVFVYFTPFQFSLLCCPSLVLSTFLLRVLYGCKECKKKCSKRS